MSALEAMRDLTDLGDPLRMFTTRQAAMVLDVHVETIRRWIRLGQLPSVRLSSGKQGKLRIRRVDLVAWQRGLQHGQR